MMKKRTVTLAKALKVKNRLVGKITAVKQAIVNYNSVEQTAEKFDTAQALELYKQLTAHLINLKDTISRANSSIQKLIYELAEVKGSAVFYATIPTRHGTFTQPYTDEKAVYVAKLRKPDMDTQITVLQARIDEIQDMLDEFNGKTTVTLEEELIEMVTAPLDKTWYSDG